jgi:hypothetical protein
MRAMSSMIAASAKAARAAQTAAPAFTAKQSTAAPSYSSISAIVPMAFDAIVGPGAQGGSQQQESQSEPTSSSRSATVCAPKAVLSNTHFAFDEFTMVVFDGDDT